MILIHERQTPYGIITVQDQDNWRGVFVNGVCQGRYYPTDGYPMSPYMRVMAEKFETYFDQIDKALVLGVGAGILTMEFERYGIITDTVEQSADMIDVAQTYFNFDPQGNIIHGDAFEKLKDLGKYDLIVYDLFNGLENAYGPDSFFDECLDHLNDSGHLLVNLIHPTTKKQYVMELTHCGN